MATLLHKLFLISGLLSLFHAAYSAAQHRSYLRITEQKFVSLPIDILTQGIVSLFVAMYGIMYIAGDFKEIRATVDLENKSWETVRNIPSFYIFNHRGKALSPNYIPPTQKSSLEENDS
ncbi:membrane magnesium transporter 1 [Cryptotermes secundus]|nr:membrane magnesium transporter 1 [Cryptotermes secundus]